MKKLKSILILTFCFALLLTTVPNTDYHNPLPTNHYDNDPEVI